MASPRRWQNDPSKVRALVAVAGLATLLALSAILWLRRVDPVEVGATLLFVPLFLAVMLGRLPGGIIGGLAASGAYVAMRLPTIETLGLESSLGLLLGRSAGYLAFGILGGWAVSRLQRSLTKLDLYDQIDDDTGLFNARYLVDAIELERSRAARYQTLFSIVALDIPSAPIDALTPRQRRKALRSLGEDVIAAIRAVDRGVHLREGATHRLVLLLPETPEQGAQVLADRFRHRTADVLTSLEVTVGAEDLSVTSWTVPGDEEQVEALREAVRQRLVSS